MTSSQTVKETVSQSSQLPVWRNQANPERDLASLLCSFVSNRSCCLTSLFIYVLTFQRIINTCLFVCLFASFVCPTGRTVLKRRDMQESQIKKPSRWQPINGVWRTCNGFLKKVNHQRSKKTHLQTRTEIQRTLFHILVEKESSSDASSTELMIDYIYGCNDYSLRNKTVHTSCCDS